MQHEIIGLQATVVASKNISQEGLTGNIIDETKNTITIKTKKGIKKLIKEQITIRIQIEKNDKNIEKTISMNQYAIRPEERLKKLKK